MIIAIDGYEANILHRVGIGRYAFEILKHIYQEVKSQKSKVPSVRLGTGKSEYQNTEFRIYLPDQPLSDMPKETDWWHYTVASPKQFWTFIGLPARLLLDTPKADVVFSPTHYIPRFTNIPRVMSIMDCSYLVYPELFKAKDLHQLVSWTRYSVHHAKDILTISEFSRNAIIEAYTVDTKRVRVTYPGLSQSMSGKTDKNDMDMQTKVKIAKNYILSVGTIQPRKNYERLIEAFSLFLKLNKQRFGVIDLVIVGKKGWIFEDIISAPKRFGIEKQVKFLDFVPDTDLSLLYKNALCFALPSLYEGFGLPVVEAMVQGCPVVVSNTSSLPEIAGKAGVYVKPESVESIAKGLLAAVRERNLKQGKWRIEKGLEQVKKFTWEQAAKQTLEILEEVGRGNPKS